MHNNRRWLITWLIAAALATGVLIVTEMHWRQHQYTPNIVDSMQLWSLQRQRVYSTKKIPLAIIGASRIEFGIDLPLIKELLPKYQPVMLAINAKYPIAVLEHLANDTAFKGVVLCDIDSMGLALNFRDMAADYVHYFDTQWTPSWRAHRELLTLWQQWAVIANPDFSVVNTIKHSFAANEPMHPYYFFKKDRSGYLDFTKTDVTAVLRHFEETLTNQEAMRPLVAPEQWLHDLDAVNQWVRQIQARGGDVIFYETPTSGTLRKLQAMVYPREQYWDRFAAITPAKTLNYADEPRLAALHLPDQSHVDMHDRADYTRALVDILVDRQLLQR